MAINGDDNTLDMVALSEKLESINRVVRAAQQNADDNSVVPAAAAADDHEAAASDTAESKSPALDELSLDNEDAEDNRNKR